MDKSLDHAIRNHYQGLELSKASLRHLERRVEGLAEPKGPLGGYQRFLIAAVVMAAIGIAMFVFVNGDDVDQLALGIINEAAMLHNQQLEVEIEAADYVAIRNGLDRLGFSPSEPLRLQAMKTRVIGARYSMIAGRPAVQIKFYDPNGDVCSLYQVPASGELASLAEITEEIDGVGVDVWQERGLLNILTRPLT